MFQRLLHEDVIRLPLEAPNFEGAVAELIATLPSVFLSPRRKSELLEILLQREFFESSAAGAQLALPHCVLPGLEEPFCALGISRKGIPFSAAESPVHFILISVFPEKGEWTPQRYELLKEVKAFFKEPFLRERLKICDSPEDAYEFLSRETQPSLPSHGFRFRVR